MKNEIMPNERFYKPELDGIRFCAFLLVFIHHHTFFATIPVFSIIYKIGWIGVDLFFVLSAFLFTKLLHLEIEKTGTVSYRKFFIRRIFRIWPIYLLFIIFSYTFLIITTQTFEGVSFYRFLGLLTFTDNFIAIVDGYNYNIPFVAHLWTIAFEEQFYLIVPILILSLTKIGSKKRLIVFLVIFIFLNFLG